MVGATNYNERSWAIDLIAHIKSTVAGQSRTIRDAGGEQTIREDGSILFPDVLLFGDETQGLILQGWELKMPDTPIDDRDFFENAEKKAKALGLNSFVLWNAIFAQLFVKNPDGEDFVMQKQWGPLVSMTDRHAVSVNKDDWKAIATEIIGDINDMLERGVISGRQFIHAYASGGITDLIMQNAGVVAEALDKHANQSRNFRAEVAIWWQQYGLEYGGGDDSSMKLAQANISNWIGKFLFAHILQDYNNNASVVNDIDNNTTPNRAIGIFDELTKQCNFFTIFSDNIGLGIIPSVVWSQILQFNNFLKDIKIGAMDQAQLSEILRATAGVAASKIRGQYPTPPVLAHFLVQLCMGNIEEDRILDPCCGSGTIARAALEYKIEKGVAPQKAAAQVYAGDKDLQALQIASFAIAKPDLMNVPQRLFHHDAFDLDASAQQEFQNPLTGGKISEKTGFFDAITSNLPFVSQGGRRHYEAGITKISGLIAGGGNNIDRKADIAAYLPFAFHSVLKDGGYLGILITNAWLATAWGEDFIKTVRRYYHLNYVITSGAGKWFSASQVSANILVMRKKANPNEAEEPVRFITLNRPLPEFEREGIVDKEAIELAVAQIIAGKVSNDSVSIHEVSWTDIDRFKPLGLAGSAQFVDCDWIFNLPLVPARSLFEIRRGERRGWDAMFYPDAGHGIENEYIKPVLKSSQDITRYFASANSDAFSCSRTLEELQKLGHMRALRWIQRFEHQTNNKGVPLPDALNRANIHWYEMKSDKLADLVLGINPGKRLFVAKLDRPSFVNQRFTALKGKDGVDIDLAHALLNSAVGLFMIEGMGFGRGLGALDLSKDKVENNLHVLDAANLNDSQIALIKAAFEPLKNRDLEDIEDELDRADRQNFDDAVITAFGLKVSRGEIYDSLRGLVKIRFTVLD